MSESMNRRDFLKLMALLAPGAFLSTFVDVPEFPIQDPTTKNVLVVVFDTFSAQHLMLNGYPRQTMPNLTRLAERATVYHNHYAGGNWTTPGTATLLTGSYPWTHRAFSQRDFIAKDREKKNIYSLFEGYYRIGYSHNPIVDRFLYQFYDQLDFLEPQQNLFTANNLSFDRLFPWDGDTAPLSWDRIVSQGEKGYTYSLFFAELYNSYRQGTLNRLLKEFPRGVPHTGVDGYFILEDAINWLMSQLDKLPRPFFGYFHYLPPHHPYNTRRDFVNVFKDDGIGYYIEKPTHPIFNQGNASAAQNLKYYSAQRQYYDEFILYVDSELGRLFDHMEQKGLFDNTWLIFTSDHGEMFERGVSGHRTPLLYQPVIQIPLMIVEPGQQKRQDITTPTSAVDVLPTLAKIAGRPIPDWTEGQVLPPFSGTTPSSDRSLFALEATNSPEDKPLGPASVMMVQGKYKLTYYFGYDQLKGIGPWFELYDTENDPQELNNIYSEQSPIAQQLRDEIMEKVKEVDKPYEK